MKKCIYAFGAIAIFFLGGCSNFNIQQKPEAAVIDNQQTDIDINVDIEAEISIEESEGYTESVTNSFSNNQVRSQTEPAISNEVLSNSSSDSDFGFDLRDLRYDEVKTLVKEIFNENHYTSYEFYQYSIDEEGNWHDTGTGDENFVVIFDSDQYWLIVYCEGNVYAIYDDIGIYARERTAKSLTLPGEEVLYGFPLTDSSAWVVICGDESERDYLVCRMGIPEDRTILLEYSQNRDDSVNDGIKLFTYKYDDDRSKTEPDDGDILYTTSLTYEDEAFIYTIIEKGIYKKAGFEIELNFIIENRQTGELKNHKGKGDMSETAGAFGTNIYERYDFIQVEDKNLLE